MIKKFLLGLLTLVVIFSVSIYLYISYSWKNDYSSQFPVNQQLVIKIDSSMIQRGKYLVYGPAHCAHCHAPIDKQDDVERGLEVPMTGGFGLDIEPGTFYAPNITMDKETGLGAKSDGEIYRALRHNVMMDGAATVDFMPFTNMSDEDIFAIIAYLKSSSSVNSKSKRTQLNIFGKALYALGAIKPQLPERDVSTTVEKGVTVEYGGYMANAVANCRGCHSKRDMHTGEYIGEFYSGGQVFGPDNLTKGWTFVSPNLTNDPKTGIMYKWTEEKFIKRMKMGRVHRLSPMPWAAFTGTDMIDLKAIYKFLKSIDPVYNEVKRTSIPPKKDD